MSAPSVRGAAAWSMAAQYLGFVIQFAVSVVISRYYLDPAAFGLFSVALAAAMVVGVLQDFGIARFIAGERDLTRAQIDTAYTVSLLFSFAIAAVLFASAWPLSVMYQERALIPLMLVIAFSYCLTPFAIVPSAVMMRDLDFRGLFTVNVGSTLANAAVAIGLAHAGWGAMALAWALVAQAAVRAVLARIAGNVRLPRPTLAGAGPIVRFGGSSSILFISGSLGTRTPELIVGRLLDFTAVGLFGRGAGITAQLFGLIVGGLGGVFYPAFRRLRDEGTPLAPGYLRVTACSTAVVWATMAGLAVAAEPLVLLLYGPVWAATAPLVMWIALGHIFLVTLPLHVELPILLGAMRTLIRVNILDTIASIALLALFASAWGVEGAAASRVAYGILWFAIYAALMQRLVGFDWRAMASLYGKSAIAAAAAVVPLFLAYRFVASPATIGFGTLAVASAIGVLCWGIAMAAIRHPALPEFIALARTIVARRAPA